MWPAYDEQLAWEGASCPDPIDAITTGYLPAACCSHSNRSSLNSASVVFGRDHPIAQPPRINGRSTLAKVRSDFMGLPILTRRLSWRSYLRRQANATLFIAYGIL